MADLAADERDSAYSNAAAALAVLGGIAAADAACCKALGRRSRSQDHHDAEELLHQITPDGDKAARSLRRLLDLKDAAQYGLFDIGGTDLRSALRQVRSLIEFAEDVLGR